MIEEEEQEHRPVRLGVVQFAPAHKDIESNIRSITDFIRSADADLLVFPELALCGYAFTTPEDALPFAVEPDGPEIAQIARVCAETQTAAVVGFCECEGEDLFNSAIAISSHGDVAGIYRKVHLFYYETKVFYAGDLGYPVFDVGIRDDRSVKVGMQICYDWRFPEVTLQLALAGAEIVAMPSNIVTTTGMLLDTLRVRAFENKVVVAFADRIGSEVLEAEEEDETLEFRGESAIIAYNGTVSTILSTSETSIGYADVDVEGTRSKRINKFNDLIIDRKILEAGYQPEEEENRDESEDDDS